MSTGEMQFLILVCSAFVALALCLAGATFQYRHWLHSNTTAAKKPRR
jgi:hypothetical protein